MLTAVTAVAAVAAVAAVVGGCAALVPMSDGTSVSWGRVNAGVLVGAVALPTRGDGYRVPPEWAVRQSAWGTEELVGLIVRAARRVDREAPGGLLEVGDLSSRRGGASQRHRSHQTGRDADLFLYVLDEADRPLSASAMHRFGDDGWTRREDERGRKLAQPRLRVDLARTWLLVRALLEDPAVDVQFLFLSAGLERVLLGHAATVGAPADLLARAAAVVHQPGGAALPHDDHLHLRVFCAAGDRAMGCEDIGPLRWLKKRFKYFRSLTTALVVAIGAGTPRPFCRVLLTGALAPR